MKHLQKFETFTDELNTENINEGIFQNAIGWINKKITNFTNSKIAPVVKKTTEIIQGNPKLQQQLANLKTTLDENSIAKLKTLAENPNSIISATEKLPELTNVTESMLLEGKGDVAIGKILQALGFVGGGLTALSVIAAGIYAQIVGSASAFQGIGYGWVILGIVAAIILATVGGFMQEQEQ